ncbi:MAG: efflux RND transporter periplasmic adaptor subunit [Pseudomonadota bacterium]
MKQTVYALCSLVVASVLVACGGEVAGTEPVSEPKYVSTVSVDASAGYTEERSYSGRVEAAAASALGFEVGGLLVDVSVDDGDTVQRGEILARLDTARLAASRSEAEAELALVLADLELAEATLKRTNDAFDYKGVSSQQLDEARQRVSALRARVRVAEARLERIDVDLAKSALRAPFDGTVVRRNADPGVVLAAGQPLIDIQSDRLPQVRIGITPAAARALTVGDRYTLKINGRDTQASLRGVVPRRDEATRTVDALFVIDGDDPVTRPGDSAELEHTSFVDAPGYWLPVAALVEGPRGLWQVLVAEDDGGAGHVLGARTLEILYSDGSRVYARGTLSGGEQVVATGTQRVVVGQAVRLSRQRTGERVAHAGKEQRNDD